MKTIIIAEAGVNHNGDMDLACRLIDVAAECGADFVKFQTFSADRIVTRSAQKAEYQQRNDSASGTQYEMLKRLELGRAAHERLIAHCEARGVAFFSTAFDMESIDLLHDLGLRHHKIPSGEITNLPYLRKIGSFGREVILSTGMCGLGEVEAAVQVLIDAGTPRNRITVLHCNTEYPTAMRDVNLTAMVSMARALGLRFGYSDHTQGIEVAVAAVALGASVIEKHFTLDKTLPGPDHAASLEPHELLAMVKAIRNIEEAMGDGIKRPGESEIKNRWIARKSLVAARLIKAGELFSSENLTSKRPGTGVSPMRIDDFIGRIASRDYQIDEMIQP